MKKLNLHLTGLAPLILHNNQSADPLNHFAKELKKVSGKRNKTPADHEQLAKIEYIAGLYLDDDVVVIPTKVLNATFVAGAKKDKNGPVAKAGVFFDEHAPLIYEGPKTPEELYEDSRFVSREPVRVSTNTVIRTRPIFPEWELDVAMSYEESVIDEDTIRLAWEKAGLVVGMCDWRPQHGRFIVS